MNEFISKTEIELQMLKKKPYGYEGVGGGIIGRLGLTNTYNIYKIDN